MANTTQEVIQALQEEGLSDDVIKVLIPILAYESRVDGVPYVLTALDSESPSYGLGQANVTTMESALWMALSESGVDIPGATDQQVAQWKRAGYDVSEEDVRDFIYIDDIVDLYKLLSKNLFLKPKKYNVNSFHFMDSTFIVMGASFLIDIFLS